MQLVFQLVFLVFILLNTNTHAFENLGVHGKTYPILENDFYEWLINKVKEKKAEDSTALSQEDVRKMIEKKLIVTEYSDLSSCKEDTTREIDLTIILEHDIKDASGNIIHSKGKVINPLNYRNMRLDFLFLDVDNLEQVEIFLQKKAQKKRPTQPMAVAGNLSHFYENVKKRNNISTPAGKSTQLMLDRFQIKCTPTLVKQKKGKVLEVIEYKIEDTK